MKKNRVKRFAIRKEGERHALYFLNQYGYVVRLGLFESYGAALWYLHDVSGDSELMSFERLCAVALGVQLVLEEWGCR